VNKGYSGAALLSLPFALYLLILHFVLPPTASNFVHADPILRWLPWQLVPFAAIAIAAGWYFIERPRLAYRQAAAGVVAAILFTLFARLAFGRFIPAFIPAEESARPGFLLSMTAGYGEELICRLLFLPIALSLTKNKWLAVFGSGLLFTAMHGFDGWPHFLVRLLIPGCGFSAAAIFVGPTFIVIAHATAHVLIPALFTG
jgi:hypothetical protein